MLCSCCMRQAWLGYYCDSDPTVRHSSMPCLRTLTARDLCNGHQATVRERMHMLHAGHSRVQVRSHVLFQPHQADQMLDLVQAIPNGCKALFMKTEVSGQLPGRQTQFLKLL